MRVAWTRVERLAVIQGIQSISMQMISALDLGPLEDELGRSGICAATLQKCASGQTFTSTMRVAAEGSPFLYWTAIGRPDAVSAAKAAFEANDQETICRLRGYPDCCARFYQEHWVNQRYIDLTWPMAENTGSVFSRDEYRIDLQCVPACNVMLRWLSPRMVFHLPCRFDCPATVAQASLFADIAHAAGFDEELAWLEDALRWPLEWSALHGIAEIKSPVARFSTRTDATAPRYVVRVSGDRYPEEGAKAGMFPYHLSSRC